MLKIKRCLTFSIIVKTCPPGQSNYKDTLESTNYLIGSYQNGYVRILLKLHAIQKYKEVSKDFLTHYGVLQTLDTWHGPSNLTITTSLIL